ncbi:unnamed protein product [Didymodactylos carnosus]|nr:unnamed protein product [Didymodactylos carnosus]CAF4039950.1 unnamed protein product [Didymodactylos carnosus]
MPTTTLKQALTKIITKPISETTKKLQMPLVKKPAVTNEPIKHKSKDNIQTKGELKTKLERKSSHDVITTSKKTSLPANTIVKSEKGNVNNQKITGKTATTSSANVSKQKIPVDQHILIKKQQQQTNSGKQLQPSKPINEHSKTTIVSTTKQQNTNNKIKFPTKLTVSKNKLMTDKSDSTDGPLSKISSASRPISVSSSDHGTIKHSSEQKKILKNTPSSTKVQQQQHQNRSNINQSLSSKKMKPSTVNKDTSKTDKTSLSKDQKSSIKATNRSNDERKHKLSNTTDSKLIPSTGVIDKKKDEQVKLTNAQERVSRINLQEKIKTNSNTTNVSKIKSANDSRKQNEHHEIWDKKSMKKSRTTSSSSPSDIEIAKINNNLPSESKIFCNKNSNNNELKQVQETEIIQISPTSPSPPPLQEQQIGPPTLSFNTNFYYDDEQPNENPHHHYTPPFSTNLSYTTGTVLLPPLTMSVAHIPTKSYPAESFIEETIPDQLTIPATTTSDQPLLTKSHIDAYNFDENDNNDDQLESKKRRYNSIENNIDSPDLLYVSSSSSCHDENIVVISSSEVSVDDQQQPPSKRARRSMSSQESGDTLSSSTSSIHKHPMNQSTKLSSSKHEYFSNYSDTPANANASGILDMTDINRPGGMSFSDIKVNDILRVCWGVNLYIARCMEKNEKTGKLSVHYNGWNSRYDEWISPHQVVELCDQSVWPIRRRRTSQVNTLNTTRQSSFVDSSSSSSTPAMVDINSSTMATLMAMDEKQMDVKNDIIKLCNIEQHEEQLGHFHSLEEVTKEKPVNSSLPVISILSIPVSSSISSTSYKPDEEEDYDEDRFSDVSSITITEANTNISEQKFIGHDLPNNELEDSNLYRMEQKQSYKDETRRRTISNDANNIQYLIEADELENDTNNEEEQQQQQQQRRLSVSKEIENDVPLVANKKTDHHEQRRQSAISATVITTPIKQEPVAKVEPDYENNLFKIITRIETFDSHEIPLHVKEETIDPLNMEICNPIEQQSMVISIQEAKQQHDEGLLLKQSPLQPIQSPVSTTPTATSSRRSSVRQKNRRSLRESVTNSSNHNNSNSKRKSKVDSVTILSNQNDNRERKRLNSTTDSYEQGTNNLSSSYSITGLFEINDARDERSKRYRSNGRRSRKVVNQHDYENDDFLSNSPANNTIRQQLEEMFKNCPSRYNFVELNNNLDGEERLQHIKDKMRECQKVFFNLRNALTKVESQRKMFVKKMVQKTTVRSTVTSSDVVSTDDQSLVSNNNMDNNGTNNGDAVMQQSISTNN